MNTAFKRASAFSSRLCFQGPLEGCTIGALRRSGRGYRLSLRWTLPDTDGEGEWVTELIVLLPDAETEEQWLRRLLLALADATGSEPGEAVTLDGIPLAQHLLPPTPQTGTWSGVTEAREHTLGAWIWPWRPQDCEA